MSSLLDVLYSTIDNLIIGGKNMLNFVGTVNSKMFHIFRKVPKTHTELKRGQHARGTDIKSLQQKKKIKQYFKYLTKYTIHKIFKNINLTRNKKKQLWLSSY